MESLAASTVKFIMCSDKTRSALAKLLKLASNNATEMQHRRNILLDDVMARVYVLIITSISNSHEKCIEVYDESC